MYADVRRACEKCAHCALDNATNHTMKWTMLPCGRPFDVIFTNIWFPIAIPSRNGDYKGLNVMDGMSGFVVRAPLTVVDSITNTVNVSTSFYQVWLSSPLSRRCRFRISRNPRSRDRFIVYQDHSVASRVSSRPTL
jgi:hypothetical protein